MRKVNKLEDSLNGGYGGLYGEVVTSDSYKIKELKFTPDVVIDIGANVGVFTRFVRELFPNAAIISIEPNPDNCEVFKRFTNLDRVVLLEKAIGVGAMVRRTDSNSLINGSHESYLPKELMNEGGESIAVNVESVMPDQIFKWYVKEGDKALVKIDCEGSEFAIFEHEESLKCLEQAEYFCFELHHEMEYWTESEKVAKRKTVSNFVQRFSKTHSIIHETVHLFGYKK